MIEDIREVSNMHLTNLSAQINDRFTRIVTRTKRSRGEPDDQPEA